MDHYWEIIIMCDFIMMIIIKATLNHSRTSNIWSTYCQRKTVHTRQGKTKHYVIVLVFF